MAFTGHINYYRLLAIAYNRFPTMRHFFPLELSLAIFAILAVSQVAWGLPRLIPTDMDNESYSLGASAFWDFLRRIAK